MRRTGNRDPEPGRSPGPVVEDVVHPESGTGLEERKVASLPAAAHFHPSSPKTAYRR